METKINQTGAKPATAADGAPTADELIAAFDVPAHRQSAVRREFAALERRRNGLAGGILSNVRVSASREDGRAMKDRIRTLGGNHLGAISAIRLINNSRARLVIYEAGVEGALAIAAMLMTAPAAVDDPIRGLRHATADEDAGLRMIGLRFVGQTMIDALVGGDDDLDRNREDAHRYITWLEVVRRDGPSDAVDREMMAELDAMTSMAALDLGEVAAMLIQTVKLVELVGPWTPISGNDDMDIFDRITLQLELTSILEQITADPAVIEAIADRKAARRRAARTAREEAADLAPLPSLFDNF